MFLFFRKLRVLRSRSVGSVLLDHATVGAAQSGSITKVNRGAGVARAEKLNRSARVACGTGDLRPPTIRTRLDNAHPNPTDGKLLIGFLKGVSINAPQRACSISNRLSV